MTRRPSVLRIPKLAAVAAAIGIASTAYAGEADLMVPELDPGARGLMLAALAVCALGIAFGAFLFLSERGKPVLGAMREIGTLIFETCKTYLIQQGKFLAGLYAIIGACIAFYFGALRGAPPGEVAIILAFAAVGILGSYAVAWFGIRMNTLANARTAFASLERDPLRVLSIPLRSGMSIGVLLVSVELAMMICIMTFVDGAIAGYCFVGFAIGESLGAAALRVAGGIFTKIADIGADLMKIVFGIKEDDPRNPGVIADCAGDNAGDSVGPTADGFETYGVTGVALVSFILLGILPDGALGIAAPREWVQVRLLAWIFSMRALMIVSSVAAYWINAAISRKLYGGSREIDYEKPLTNLIWISAALSICATFAASRFLLGDLGGDLWAILSTIISVGTLGAALIPELTKVFTSTSSKHTREVVAASREGGASLNVLSGFVSGSFGAFWIGALVAVLMAAAFVASLSGVSALTAYPAIFAFGLVAFGFLGMGPVTIAVDSYGPVTDNAQSVYELSLVEEIPDVSGMIERDFGFRPDFARAKRRLEANDGAGNTFKATAKPVLIGTAVVGAMTMMFSLILVIRDTLGIRPEDVLNLLNPYTLLGLIMGAAVIHWFSGASAQAVITGAYSAVAYIKRNIYLDAGAGSKAATENSKEVVGICTRYAQRGTLNIFMAVLSFSLALAFLSGPANGPGALSFFVSYLLGLSVFGLFQAIFMANAGGCWDNAKKIVEVELEERNTPLHEATIVGDTVGDPFKDTSSVALNPVIKFTTLFGLLAMEIAISPRFAAIGPSAGLAFLAVALVFVWRSFYSMRIPVMGAGSGGTRTDSPAAPLPEVAGYASESVR
jgi:K(+)-stimulated pyrophosphate-energized sodium pump